MNFDEKSYPLDFFFKEIENNCSQIAHLSIIHICEKLYSDGGKHLIDRKTFYELISNYSYFFRYLNDFAGTIYKKHNSSVEDIYKEIINFYQLELDNEYRFAHILRKLEKQTPQLLMSLQDEDIQKQTIDNFEEKLDSIKRSQYFKDNHSTLFVKIEKLEKNITLVKKATQHKK